MKHSPERTMAAEQTPQQTKAVDRREFLAASASAAGAALFASRAARGEESPLPFPPVDLHVHLDNSTIDAVVELSGRLGVKFGIVEHAGTEENEYPVVLSSDEELAGYLAMLEGKPVYRGVQAEWTDWSSGFSPEVRGRLDYVLMDAMTYPGKDGRRVKLWTKEAETLVDMDDRQAFMDRYVDFHVELIEKQPIDILGNASWLPRPLADQYEAFWTRRRIGRVVRAAVEHSVAIEISASLKLPKPYFLELAKDAGAKFTFGSNGRYPNMGKLDYAIEAARDVGLTAAEMFLPDPPKGTVPLNAHDKGEPG